MEAGDIKTLLAALALPPAGLLLVALAGLAMARGERRAGISLAVAALLALWLLSCNAVAVYLAQHVLPQHPPATLAQLRQDRVQAVVVLGGGVLDSAPEFGQPQPSESTLGRLRYGARLARMSGLPLAFSGGRGWSGRGAATEGEAAGLSARNDFGVDLRWVDARSRDTAENALFSSVMLRRDGVTRVALVTDATHMPRAALEFRRAGFQVIAAPTGLPAPRNRPLLEWLPSAHGLSLSRQVLREWIALTVARLR